MIHLSLSHSPVCLPIKKLRKTCLLVAMLLLFLSSCCVSQTSKLRDPIFISDFGAKGDGQTNDTEAFQKAAAYLQEHGGTLIIDSGTYIVGRQKLSGHLQTGGSWIREPILEFINCKKPISVVGKKAVLKAEDGLKYGSFNPITGFPDTIRKYGNLSDYQASAYIFIDAQNCASIMVSGLEFDGNSAHLDIVPMYHSGNQLPAIGIRLYNNQKASVSNCYIHHCGLDGIIIGWTGLTTAHKPYPHTIHNVRSLYNGRQGISWVGGNMLTVTNSEFSHTGKALNNGLPVWGAPSAGIDIEIENSIIRNGYFEDCLVSDNTGYGVSALGEKTFNINFKRVKFVGTTNEAAAPKSQNFSFDSCVFVGRVAGIHGDPIKQKANYFKDCLFTMDPEKSPSRRVFGNHSAFYDAENVVFENCTFDAVDKELPRFNQKELLFINCTFIQESAEDFRAIATFKGKTQFIMKGKGRINAAEASFEGPVYLNGKKAANRAELNNLQN